MQIQITKKVCGGTLFQPEPHRLHLGAQNAAGVDELQFSLPEEWQGCGVALYLRRADGYLPAPIALDAGNCVTVDRRLTGCTHGQWMLSASDGKGFTACSVPGTYDCCATLPIDGNEEELPPSQYEQFVARVLESASAAAEAAKKAAASQTSASDCSALAQTAARQASASSNTASNSAARAEAAASRAEQLSPAEGQVLSVNGKGGAVTLTAQDLGALPCPAQPAAGALLRIFSVDPETGSVTLDTMSAPDLDGYVRRDFILSASTAGAVRVNSAYGISVRADGTLCIIPASADQLEAMADVYAPLTPALLPYGVKQALTASRAAAQWSDAEKSGLLQFLGADLSLYYTRDEADAHFATPYILTDGKITEALGFAPAKITCGTADLTAGSSALADGEVYLVYSDGTQTASATDGEV